MKTNYKKIVPVVIGTIMALVAMFQMPNAVAAQTTAPGFDATIRAIFADGGTAIEADKSELHIQGDEVANSTYQGTKSGNMWAYFLRTQKSVEVKGAKKIILGKGCVFTSGQWFACSLAQYQKTAPSTPAAPQSAVSTSIPQGIPRTSDGCIPFGWKGYSQKDTLKPGFCATVVIMSSSSAEQLVLKVSTSEVYVQGNSGNGTEALFFNNTFIPDKEGLVRINTQGATAFEVKFAKIVTSENSAFVIHGPGDGWFEYHRGDLVEMIPPTTSTSTAPSMPTATATPPAPPTSPGILSDISKMVASWAQSPLFWIMLAIIVLLALIGILISGRRAKP